MLAVSGQSAEFVQSPLQCLPSTIDWSAQSSTPVAQSNRFAVLSSEGENDRDGVGNGDGVAAAYMMVQRGKKRARQQSQPPFTSLHQQQSSATLPRQQQQ